jgi:hypothetical protein
VVLVEVEVKLQMLVPAKTVIAAVEVVEVVQH